MMNERDLNIDQINKNEVNNNVKNKETKLSTSNSCSKLKSSVSKITELNVNQLRETSDFGKIDS